MPIVGIIHTNEIDVNLSLSPLALESRDRNRSSGSKGRATETLILLSQSGHIAITFRLRSMMDRQSTFTSLESAFGGAPP